jgi:mutator protein MutT
MERERDAQAVDVVIAIVRREGKILICRRRRQDMLGGYWEFPGGKLQPGESHKRCLARELHEELLIRARPLEALEIIEYDYPHARVRLHPYLCEHTEGEPQPLASDQVRWIDAANLPDYSFPPANDSLIQRLTEALPPRITPALILPEAGRTLGWSGD